MVVVVEVALVVDSFRRWLGSCTGCVDRRECTGAYLSWPCTSTPPSSRGMARTADRAVLDLAEAVAARWEAGEGRKAGAAEAADKRS